jgi:LysR family glycine cleavage system transcriptional activator
MHALAAFEAAARLQTFAAAAEELCVTQSAISHRIRQLEEHFGVRLFVRVHKQVVLTPPGQAFLTEVRESMRRLGNAAARVSDQPAKKLRVTASPSLAFTVLIPHLKEYFERSGYVDIEIDTSTREHDMGEDRYDLALRFGTGDWPGFTAELLVEERLLALASPAYARGFGSKRSLSDLARATLIHNKALAWGPWFKAVGGGKAAPPPEGLVFVEVAGAIDAAIHGLGVVLANRGTSAIARRNGSLVPFVDATVPSQRHYYGVYRRDSPRYETIRDFLDWITPLVARTFV